MVLVPAKLWLKVMASVSVSVFPDSEALDPAAATEHWLLASVAEVPNETGPNHALLASFIRYKCEPSYRGRHALATPIDGPNSMNC